MELVIELNRLRHQAIKLIVVGNRVGHLLLWSSGRFLRDVDLILFQQILTLPSRILIIKVILRHHMFTKIIIIIILSHRLPSRITLRRRTVRHSSWRLGRIQRIMVLLQMVIQASLLRSPIVAIITFIRLLPNVLPNVDPQTLLILKPFRAAFKVALEDFSYPVLLVDVVLHSFRPSRAELAAVEVALVLFNPIGVGRFAVQLHPESGPEGFVANWTPEHVLRVGAVDVGVQFPPLFLLHPD